jgi:uncharacterized membrane protein YkoI
MIKLRALVICGLAIVGFALSSSSSRGQKRSSEVKLPNPVKKTFAAKFPNGEIFKVDVEEENGVTVYDLEFKDGGVEKETDITADGTMLEFTVVVDAKAVPEAVMKTIKRAAEGATIKRIECVEIGYDTKEGKVIKRPKPVTRYEVELAKGKRTAEFVVAQDGKVVEPARWGPEEKVQKHEK